MLRDHPPIFDWDSVDWSMSNAQIADQLGAARQTVYKWRRRLSLTSDLPPRIDWGQVPDLETEHCSVLSKRLGCSEAAVRRAQQRRGYSTAKQAKDQQQHD